MNRSLNGELGSIRSLNGRNPIDDRIDEKIGNFWILSTNELYPKLTTYNLLLGNQTNSGSHKLLCDGKAKITGVLTLGGFSDVATTLNNNHSSITSNTSLINVNASNITSVTNQTNSNTSNLATAINRIDGHDDDIADIKNKYKFSSITGDIKGKILIGKGSGTLMNLATLTAGTNITITNGDGSITITNGITNNNQLSNGSNFITASSTDTLTNKTITSFVGGSSKTITCPSTAGTLALTSDIPAAIDLTTSVNFGTAAEGNITVGRAQNSSGTALQFTNDCSNQYFQISTGGYFRVAKGYITSGVSSTNAGLDISSIGTLRSNGSLSCDGDISANNKCNIYGNSGNLTTSGIIETYSKTTTAGLMLTYEKNTTTGGVSDNQDVKEEGGNCVYQGTSGTNGINDSIRLGRGDQGNQIIINDIAGARYGIATGNYDLCFRKGRASNITALSRSGTTATGTAPNIGDFDVNQVYTIQGITSDGDYWNGTHTLIAGSSGTTFKFTINAFATASPTFSGGSIESMGSDENVMGFFADTAAEKGSEILIKFLSNFETSKRMTLGGETTISGHLDIPDMKKIYFGNDLDYSLFFDDTGATGGVHNHLQLEAKTGNDFNFQWNGDGSTENNLKFSWYISSDPADPMGLYNYTGGTWSSPIMTVQPNSTRDLDAITMKNHAVGDVYRSIGVMNDGSSTLRWSKIFVEDPTQGYWRNLGLCVVCDDSSNAHRATMELRTVRDEGSEFFFSNNGMPRWDLSCRASGDSYVFMYYSNTTVTPTDSWTPSFGSGSNMCLQITTAGVITSPGGFNPFTGSHNCKINDTINYQEGLIIEVDDAEVKDVNNSNFTCKLCDTENSKCVLGVISHKDRPCHNDPKKQDTDPFPDGTFLFNWAVNGVGEGAIWITNKNGNINKGDLIVSSSIAGYGMLQEDDIIRSKTVAKCMKNINWDSISDTIENHKKVLCPCIYLCG